jgi:hypothetical protein
MKVKHSLIPPRLCSLGLSCESRPTADVPNDRIRDFRKPSVREKDTFRQTSTSGNVDKLTMLDSVPHQHTSSIVPETYRYSKQNNSSKDYHDEASNFSRRRSSVVVPDTGIQSFLVVVSSSYHMQQRISCHRNTTTTIGLIGTTGRSSE